MKDVAYILCSIKMCHKSLLMTWPCASGAFLLRIRKKSRRPQGRKNIQPVDWD
jgi:hypothetical protein